MATKMKSQERYLCKSRRRINVVAPEPACHLRKYAIKPVMIKGTDIRGTDIAEKVWRYMR